VENEVFIYKGYDRDAIVNSVTIMASKELDILFTRRIWLIFSRFWIFWFVRLCSSCVFTRLVVYLFLFFVVVLLPSLEGNDIILILQIRIDVGISLVLH